jgi:hypothetical protein
MIDAMVRKLARIYHGCRQRCNNKKLPIYHRYGGRGIKCLISKEELKALWVRDKADLMKRPSIDRIDNDGNYEFNNCRFIELSINAGRSKAEQDKCIKGHKYTKENTRIIQRKTGNPYRQCLVCDKEHSIRQYAKLKSEYRKWLKEVKPSPAVDTISISRRVAEEWFDVYIKYPHDANLREELRKALDDNKHYKVIGGKASAIG